MSILSQVNAKRKGLFYGWWVVAATTFINAVGVGVYFYGWSPFFKPLIREFGWSRTQVSFISSLSRLEGGIEGPVAGWLIDKFGARKIVLISAVITGASFMALFCVNSFWQLCVIKSILATGYNLGFTHGTLAAVAKWFIKKRSQALSYLTTGNGIGGAILVPLLAWMIAQHGWRWTSVIIGVFIWVTVLPVAVFGVRDSAEQMGLLPDGVAGGQAKESEQKDKPAEATVSTGAYGLAEVNFTWREALRTQAFWVFSIAMFGRAAVLSAIVLHEIPHLTDVGIPEVQAAAVLGLMVLLSIPGRLGFGWLGDRMSKKLLMFITSLLQAGGVFILIRTTNISMAYLFVIVYGLGYGGAIPLSNALRADLFGRESFATIGGMITLITTASGVGGPLVAGYVYDVTQSYILAFTAFAVMISVSGALFLFIKQPKPPTRLALARR